MLDPASALPATAPPLVAASEVAGAAAVVPVGTGLTEARVVGVDEEATARAPRGGTTKPEADQSPEEAI